MAEYGPVSQEISADHQAFGAGRDLTINNYLEVDYERLSEFRVVIQNLVDQALEFGWTEGSRGCSGQPYAWVDWKTDPPKLRWADEATESTVANKFHELGLDPGEADEAIRHLLRRRVDGQS